LLAGPWVVGVYAPRLTNGLSTAILADAPLLTVSTCSWMYIMKVVDVHRPSFIMVVVSTPWLKSAMAPPEHREWDPTMPLWYPYLAALDGLMAVRTAVTMSLLVT